LKLLILERPGFQCGAPGLLRLEELSPAPEVELIAASSVTAAFVRDAEAIFGFVPPPLLREAKALRWLHLPGPDASRYADLSLYASRDILLTRSTGVYGVPAAEHALALMLALCRGIPQLAARSGEDFSDGAQDEITELYGATALIVGLGDVGRTLASRLRAFHCRIWGVRQNLLHKPDCVDDVFPLTALPELLPQADFVVLCLPKTARTAGLFDGLLLFHCKPGGILVNIGHGGALDSFALADALRVGRLRGAGLDVTEPEPLPAGHPLLDLPNVLLTPHTAGLGPHTQKRRFELFLDLLTRYLGGRQLHSQVDFFKGY
jgi:phosphoglycerate dehydrogenase-like enzyme